MQKIFGCFAVLLKTLQYEGKFPTSQKEIPKAVVQFIARQIDVPSEVKLGSDQDRTPATKA